jgi:prolyl-tRNA editing enzyme YbaK/EbsC (Cys-tRNA(Pro) deacylase)
MADVTTFLDEAGLDFEVLEHAHTERAADEAAALGVSSTEVAKTLVLTAPEGNVRAEAGSTART